MNVYRQQGTTPHRRTLQAKAALPRRIPGPQRFPAEMRPQGIPRNVPVSSALDFVIRRKA